MTFRKLVVKTLKIVLISGSSITAGRDLHQQDLFGPKVGRKAGDEDEKGY